MANSMSHVGPILTEIDIKRCEKAIGVNLPQEYKEFLLSNNGGCPDKSIFSIKDFVNNPEGKVQLFFSIRSPVASRNLDWNFEVFLGRVPKGMIPIARDDGGNLVCLSVEDGMEKGVFFWDHDEETEPAALSNVYWLANNFKDFFGMMN